MMAGLENVNYPKCFLVIMQAGSLNIQSLGLSDKIQEHKWGEAMGIWLVVNSSSRNAVQIFNRLTAAAASWIHLSSRLNMPNR
jgi:hypothetical protein